MDRLLVFPMLLSSCVNPDYQLYGIDIYLIDGFGPSEEELTQATEFFVEAYAEFAEQPTETVRNRLERVAGIEWHEKPIVYIGEKYNGLYHHTYTQVRYIDSCIYKSAYFHELIHHMNYMFRRIDTVDERGSDQAIANGIMKRTALSLHGCLES